MRLPWMMACLVLPFALVVSAEDAGPAVGAEGGPANTVAANSIDVPWRTSIGASLIWDSPFGPLRGDFAHVVNKSTADKTQVFQLTMSSLF